MTGKEFMDLYATTCEKEQDFHACTHCHKVRYFARHTFSKRVVFHMAVTSTAVIGAALVCWKPEFAPIEVGITLLAHGYSIGNNIKGKGGE